MNHELFVRHPVGFVLGASLVFRPLSAEGELLRPFMLTAEREFLSAELETLDLVEQGAVGVAIAHPAAMTDEDVQRFCELFADHELLQPFLQLERPVVRHVPPWWGEPGSLGTANALAVVGSLSRRGFGQGEAEGGTSIALARTMGGPWGDILVEVGHTGHAIAIRDVAPSHELRLTRIAFHQQCRELDPAAVPPEVLSEVAVDVAAALGRGLCS